MGKPNHLGFYIRNLDTPTSTLTELFPGGLSSGREDDTFSIDGSRALCSSACVGEGCGTAFERDDGWENMVVSGVPTRIKGFPEMPSSGSDDLPRAPATDLCSVEDWPTIYDCTLAPPDCSRLEGSDVL